MSEVTLSDSLVPPEDWGLEEDSKGGQQRFVIHGVNSYVDYFTIPDAELCLTLQGPCASMAQWCHYDGATCTYRLVGGQGRGAPTCCMACPLYGGGGPESGGDQPGGGGGGGGESLAHCIAPHVALCMLHHLCDCAVCVHVCRAGFCVQVSAPY